MRIGQVLRASTIVSFPCPELPYLATWELLVRLVLRFAEEEKKIQKDRKSANKLSISLQAESRTLLRNSHNIPKEYLLWVLVVPKANEGRCRTHSEKYAVPHRNAFGIHTDLISGR